MLVTPRILVMKSTMAVWHHFPHHTIFFHRRKVARSCVHGAWTFHSVPAPRRWPHDAWHAREVVL